MEAANNIICADNGHGIYKYAGATILSLTSNLFCNGMDKLLAGYNGEDYVQYDSLDELTAITGNASGNLIGDPKFVDEAGINFHISSGSAAIDTGEDLGGLVNDDIDGEARPNGDAYDIGADEY